MKPRREISRHLRLVASRLARACGRRPLSPMECKRDDVLFQKMEETLCRSGLFCRKSLSVDLLAQELNTNRTYVSGVLRRRGYTFSAYINGFRVQYVIFLLCNNADESMPAEVIADMCGFMSVRTLNYYLRKTFGISLSVLRKRISAIATSDSSSMAIPAKPQHPQRRSL